MEAHVSQKHWEPRHRLKGNLEHAKFRTAGFKTMALTSGLYGCAVRGRTAQSCATIQRHDERCSPNPEHPNTNKQVSRTLNPGRTPNSETPFLEFPKIGDPDVVA